MTQIKKGVPIMKQRADGRWVKKIIIEGKTKYFYSVATTEKKAESDITMQLLNYNKEKHIEKTNFLKIAQKMLEKKEASTSYNNFVNYTNQLKHLEPFFDCNIEDITIAQLQSFFNDMHTQMYGYWSLQKTKTVLSLIYKEAMLNGCNVANIVDLIRLPKAKKEMVHSPDDEIISIIKANASADFGMWAMMLLCTGMRRGELAAIQKKDIDFASKIISITKSIEYTPNQPNIKMPKTPHSIRKVPIIDILSDQLKAYCKSLKEEDYLFGGKSPYSLTMLRKRWARYIKDIDINITQHQLRHAYSFLLYRSGIDVKTAQYLLGHSNYATTMNIYTDFDKEKLGASSSLLNTTLCGI